MSGRFLGELREHYGSRWPKLRDGIERSGEFICQAWVCDHRRRLARHIAAAGVALKLMTERALMRNCGAPASALRKIGCSTTLDLALGDGKEHRSGARGMALHTDTIKNCKKE